MALLWLLACTDPGSRPAAVAPTPARLAAAALTRPTSPRSGPRFEDGTLVSRGLRLTLGPSDGWVQRGVRATRDDGPVTRWWQDSAAGLEFGATLRAPVDSLTWETTARVEPDGDGGVYLRGEGTWLHVHGLRVVDAAGRTLPARFADTPDALRVDLDLRGAVYPVEVDPLVSGDWATAAPSNALAWMDMDADGYDDFAIGDAFDTVTTRHEGRILVYTGSATGPGSAPTWVITGIDEDGLAGSSLSSGDFNGDGYGDLAVGAPGVNGDAGRVDVHSGSTAGPGEPTRIDGLSPGLTFGMGSWADDVNRDGYTDLFVTMAAPIGVWLYMGSASGIETTATWALEIEADGVPSVTTGDLDADGWPDLVIGMEQAEDTAEYEGTVGWIYGGAHGFGSSFDATWSGGEAFAKCGHTVAVGDWNVDGYADTAVSCPWHDEWFAYAGRLVVFNGSDAGASSSPDWEQVGITQDRTLGLGMARLDDLDGDGDDELFVAGQGDFKDGPGQADVYTGDPAGLDLIPAWSWAGSADAYVATIGVADGDVDGDGYNDLLIGSGLIGETGRTWLVPGGPDGPASGIPGWRADEFGSFADSVSFVGDLDADGTEDLFVGAVDDEFGDSHVYGYPGTRSGLAADPFVDLPDTNEAAFGAAVVGVGDVDGDGLDDVAVGAPLADGTYDGGGAVYLYRGDGAGLEATPTTTLEGTEADLGLGRVLRGVGDTNGDGYRDLAVGLPNRDVTCVDEGEVQIFGGDASGLLSTPYVILDGGQDGASLGMSIDGAGDVDGDGRDDVLLGVPGWTETYTGEGKVELWLGAGRGLDVAPIWTVYGGAEAARAGSAAGGGDVNGDGVPDVLIGAPGLGTASVYLGFGDTPDWTVTGEVLSEFGATLSIPGDLDGDGDDEVAIGSPGWNDTEGAAWVYTGEPGGLSDVPAMSWRGGWPGAAFGAAFAAGDADGDGLADLVITSPGVEMVELWYGGPLDGDGDGSKNDVDCDDTDPTVSPTATETEDGRDEDCDSVVDDPPTWFADHDGDGFGEPTSALATFSPPSGAVALGADCDDTRADIFPGATEVCDDADQDCDGTVDEAATDAIDWWSDSDGDGYAGTWVARDCDAPADTVATDDDCDDRDGTINPGALEACDGIDNDCSGVLDDDADIDALTVYQDVDGDSFGDDLTRSNVCAIPAGWVLTGGDCDDTTAEVSPAVEEVCNGVDDDCSGGVDDDATDALTRYGDADGDHYGDPALVYVGCSVPVGYVSNAEDCDDTDDAIRPEADELCDGVDQDCDGEADEDPIDGTIWHLDGDGDGYGHPFDEVMACTLPEGYTDNTLDCDDGDPTVGLETTWWQDLDGDGWGDDAQTGAACTQPFGYARVPGDCDDLRDDVFPGAVEVCDEVDDDCDGGVDNDAVDQIFWYLDLDGDGLGDPDTGTFGCTAPDTAIDNPSDCDDTDATIGLPSTFFPDLDGDGWGDDAAAFTACPTPEGATLIPGDCDDTDAAVSPDAAEVCNEVDDDCDGAVDDDPVVTVAWYTDADGDGYGDPATRAAACAPNGEQVANSLDCDDTDPAIHPEAVETFYDGVDQDCDGQDRDADGDGWPVDTDCDDHDSSVFPGADEAVGDGVDSDCDGADPAAKVAPTPAPADCGCAATSGEHALVAVLLGLAALRRRATRVLSPA